jgi:hypothetical protein
MLPITYAIVSGAILGCIGLLLLKLYNKIDRRYPNWFFNFAYKICAYIAFCSVLIINLILIGTILHDNKSGIIMRGICLGIMPCAGLIVIIAFRKRSP